MVVKQQSHNTQLITAVASLEQGHNLCLDIEMRLLFLLLLSTLVSFREPITSTCVSVSPSVTQT